MQSNPLNMDIGIWSPDLPDLNNPGSPNVRNVYPRSAKSYGPVASPSVYSDALNARCQGLAAFWDEDGNVHLFAGTASKLYHMEGGTTSWTDVSAGGGYNCPSTTEWRFNLMNGIVLATDYNDVQQSFTLGSSSAFGTLAAAAPQALYGAVVKNFYMVGNTFDSTDGARPQRAWWSALNDPTNWPTPGTITAAELQSSFNDLLGDYGAITGVVGNLGNADGAIFMQKAVWRVLYAGPPGTFDFFPAEGGVGCNIPGSIVAYANMAYYWGPDGPYKFDGAEATPIGVDQWAKTVYADLDQGNLSRVKGTVDPINRLIIWAYPGAGNSNGNPNHLVLYNWVLDRAAIVDLTCETVASLLSLGYTLDELYTELGYTLDDLPAPLDSTVWTGGSILLSVADTNHCLDFMTGPNLAPTVDTKEIEPFPGRRWRSNGVKPLTDGDTQISVALGRRDNLQSNVAFTPAVAINSLGICPVRTSGRLGRARITRPAGSVWGHIWGAVFDGVDAGLR